MRPSQDYEGDYLFKKQYSQQTGQGRYKLQNLANKHNNMMDRNKSAVIQNQIKMQEIEKQNRARQEVNNAILAGNQLLTVSPTNKEPKS